MNHCWSPDGPFVRISLKILFVKKFKSFHKLGPMGVRCCAASVDISQKSSCSKFFPDLSSLNFSFQRNEAKKKCNICKIVVHESCIDLLQVSETLLKKY